MDRESRQQSVLALVGGGAILVALHDGLSLAAPVGRVAVRAPAHWVVIAAAALAAVVLGWWRRRRGFGGPGNARHRSATGRWYLPVAVAAIAFVIVVLGVHREALHARPTVEYAIETGWGGPLNYQEREYVELAAIGVLGAIAGTHWQRAAVASVLAGGLLLVHPLQFLFARLPDVYTGLPVAGGATGELVLGAEPLLLALGGLLLGLTGWLGLHRSPRATSPDETGRVPRSA